jgi:hypothetical protein
MKIFISWSGPTSHRVAIAVRTLVQDVLPDVTPWVSSHDIDAGKQWSLALSNELADSNFGVLCLTPMNLRSPWLLFEAGSLAKHPTVGHMVPYLYGLKSTDIEPPLSLFQGLNADQDGTLALLRAINGAKFQPLTDDRLVRSFGRWWPDFQEALEELWNETLNEENAKTERALLLEVHSEAKKLAEAVGGLRRTFETEPMRRMFQIIEEVESLDPARVEERLESARRAADADWGGTMAAQFWLDTAECWLDSGRSRHSKNGVQSGPLGVKSEI